MIGCFLLPPRTTVPLVAAVLCALMLVSLLPFAGWSDDADGAAELSRIMPVAESQLASASTAAFVTDGTAKCTSEDSCQSPDCHSAIIAALDPAPAAIPPGFWAAGIGGLSGAPGFCDPDPPRTLS